MMSRQVICLMQLVLPALVLGTSSSVHSCLSGQCEGESDSSVLIQQNLRISEAGRSAGSRGIPLLDELQGEVESIVHSKSKTDPSSSSKIKNIQALVTNEILPELLATHAAALADVNALSKAVSACNQNSTKEYQAVKVQVGAMVKAAEGNHSGCRSAEIPLNESKNMKCGALHSFLKAITLPAALPSSKTAALMGPYLKAMSTYFCPKHGMFVQLDSNCTTATTAYKSHQDMCNMLQQQYESDFCTWRTRYLDTCAAAKSCYANTVAAYKAKEVSTQVLVAKWKTEFAGLKKILCYVNVWLSDNNASTVSDAALNACQGSSVDTSAMDIKFPGVPCAIECDTTPVQSHPGTEGFLAAYGAHASAVQKVIPCLPTGTNPSLLEETAEDLDDPAEMGLDDTDEHSTDDTEDLDDPAEIGLVETAPSGRTTTVQPFDCKAHPNAVQVLFNKKAKAYDVKALDVSSGKYTAIYSIPKTRTKPKFTALNSCGINPQDSILYCVMLFKMGRKKKAVLQSHLVRLDSSNVRYVTKIFSGTVKQYSVSNSGGFDEAGNFYYNRLTKGGEGVYDIPLVHTMVDFAKVTQDPAPTRHVISLTGLPITGDLVALHRDFEGTGIATYVIGVMKGGKLLVIRVTQPQKKWVLVADGHEAGGVHFYGAGWNFQGKVYFANNQGHGVYEVLLDKINLNAGTAVVAKVGQSEPSRSNDGVNCLAAPPPFQKVEEKFSSGTSQTANCFKENYSVLQLQ